MATTTPPEVDVVVVGGGPGGSTAATLVAKAGHSVVLLEKERFPRHQIGESLLPSTIHGICRLTGVYDKVADAGFTKKLGGTYRWGANPEPWTFSFALSPNIPGDSAFAFQVERSVFDKILLDHAAESGVDVRQECSVTEVCREGDRVTGVRYADAHGAVSEVRAKYVIDASGNRGRLHREVGGERRYSDFFRSVALYGYFEGGKRLAPPLSGNILSAAFGSGWFWYIPLSDTLTSVGAVVRHEEAERIQGDPDAALSKLITECPVVADLLADAHRVTDGEYGQLRVRKDYSYHNTKFWAPGMALIGDAACFVDPVFSTGVHLATYSGMLVARSINSCLAGSLDEATAFSEFEQRYRREFATFYEYLTCFYDMHSDESSYFWNAKKITRSTDSDMHAFVELVAGVASGEAVFPNVAESRDRFAEDARQYALAVDELVSIDEASMLPLYKSSVVERATVEGVQLQTLVEVGAEFEEPLLSSGLVASDDGLSWVRQ